jgi:hypothetical protein
MLEAVILKAMSKDRAGRQPTALALQQELNALLSQRVAPAQEAPLGKNLFEDDTEIKGQRPGSRPAVRAAGPSSSRTMLRPADAEPTSAAPPPPAGGSKAWLWIVLLVVLLGGGGAAFYFLYWVPHQAGTAEPDGGTVAPEAPDAGAVAPADAGATAPPDAGVAQPVDAGPPPPADAGAVAPEAPDAGPAPEEISEAAKLQYQAGKELVAQGKVGKAVLMFEKAIQKSPNYAVAYKMLGMCHMRLGDAAKAKKNYQLYLEKAPEAEDRKDIEDLINSL